MAKKVKIIHIRKHKFNAKSLFMKKKKCDYEGCYQFT